MRSLQNQTQQRKTKEYRCYLVKPVGDFSPKNWREKPKRFTIAGQVMTTKFIGKADAWRFLVNHKSIEDGNAGSVWAVWLTGGEDTPPR